MKSIIYLLITVLTFVTYGKTSSSKDPNELIKLGNKMIPRKEVHEMLRRANLKRTGGVHRILVTYAVRCLISVGVFHSVREESNS